LKKKLHKKHYVVKNSLQSLGRVINNSPKELIKAAEKALQTGIYYLAIDCYNAAIRLDRGCQDAYIGRAGLRNIFDDSYGAIKDLEKALKIEPVNAKANYYMGLTLNNMKRFEEAIPFFDKAIASSNKESAVVSHYGKAYAKHWLKDWDGAINELNSAIGLNEKMWVSFSLRGQANAAKGSAEEALKDFETALEQNPRDSATLILKGELLLAMKRYQEALDTFNTVEQQVGEQSAIQHRKGIARIGLAEHFIAIQELNKGIQKDKEDGTLFYSRAVAKNELGDYLGAKNDLNRAIELEPLEALYYLMLGRMFLKLNKIEDAYNNFSKAGELGCKEAYDEIREHCNK
jgi:tetratricopeptide (TPR) repeat protein